MNFLVSIPFLFVLSMILTFFTGWLLGFFILITALQDRVARAFARLSLAFSLWAISHFLWQITERDTLRLIYIKLGLLVAVLIAISFVDFCTRFIESLRPVVSYESIRKHCYHGALALGLLVITDLFGWSGLLVHGGMPKSWFIFWPQPGPWFPLFLLFTISCFVYGFTLLVETRQKVPGVSQRQIDVILAGMVIAFLGFLNVYLFWYPHMWPPIGGLFIPIFILGTFYAITKHHLFNIKVITTEILIFVIWIFLFVRILLSVSFQERIFDVGVFLFVFFFGLFVIRSVWNEVRQRRQVEILSAELRDLNMNLQKKVNEQTKTIKYSYEIEKKARIELQELDEAKDQFILTMQHHLRTPLTIMKGYLQMTLMKKYQSLDGEARSYLSKIAQGIERIASLVNELLDISELKIGDNLLKMSSVHMKELVEEVREELAGEIERKHLTCTIDFSSEADSVRVTADQAKIKEAIYNLMDNAVKYTTQGGIGVRGVLVQRGGKVIYQIAIQDTGIGIPADELLILFEQYFQRGRLARAMYVGGRGLGLILSKKIVEIHQGTLSAASAGEGKGATFTLELPIIQSHS